MKEQDGVHIVEEFDKKAHRFRVYASIALVVIGGLSIYGIWQNRMRIDDIQKSRIQSCQKNYLNTRKIFRPFFPPKGHRTHKQQKDIEKFIRRTNPNQCFEQVEPK